MESLTRTQHRLLWIIIELNLILWLIVFGAVWRSSTGDCRQADRGWRVHRRVRSFNTGRTTGFEVEAG